MATAIHPIWDRTDAVHSGTLAVIEANVEHGAPPAMIFHHDQQTLTRDATPVEAERRRYPRFPVALRARCSIAGGPDADCTTVDMSLGGVALRTTARAIISDRVVIVLPRIGFVEAVVARPTADGFAAAFTVRGSQSWRLTRLLVAVLTGTGPTEAERPADADVDGIVEDRDPWSFASLLRA